jgi:hypothetical protein
MLKLTCKGLNCKDARYDYKARREDYWNLEQIGTIKKNFELVVVRTQLKIGANEEKVSHIAFQNKKWIGIIETITLKPSCSSNTWGQWSPFEKTRKNV